MNRLAKIIAAVMNFLTALIYILFIFAVSSMFSFVPWYDESGTYLVYLVLIWIPLCVITLINVLLRLISRDYRRSLVSLACLNAIYIPLIFGLGYLSIKLWVVQLIGVTGSLTMLLYFVLTLIFFLKNKKRNKVFDFKNRKI